MSSNQINHQPLFGKNSNVINSPKNINPSIGTNNSLSPIPNINIQQPSSVLLQPSTNFGGNFSIQSPINGNITSPFNMMFGNTQQISTGISANTNAFNHNSGLISNDTTPLRLMNSPISTTIASVNNVSSLRSDSIDNGRYYKPHKSNTSPGLVSKSYKFEDNSKELHKTVLYIRNKKSFSKSKQPVDNVFFELLSRLSGRSVSLKSDASLKNSNNSFPDTKIVTFNGNNSDSHITHISNNHMQNNRSDKSEKKTDHLATPLSTKSLSSSDTLNWNEGKYNSAKSNLLNSSTSVDQYSNGSEFYKECELCAKKFDNPHSYKMHNKQHVIMNGGKNVCPKCYKGFARTDAMKRHLGTKTCERNRKKLIEENNGIMPDRPPSEVIMEKELDV
ncbi:hypothetical protein QEN19_002043 [Hanseniaspora menglaensis]